MRRFWLMIMIGTLLITACGGAPDTEPAATLAPTAVPVEPTQAETIAGAVPSPTGPPPAVTAVPDHTPTTAPTDTPASETAVSETSPTEIPTPTETPPEAPPAPVEAAPPIRYNTAIILDASGSMMADLGGNTRLKIAQDAIGDLSAALPASINASLWVYGHRVEQDDQAASCQDIEQVIPLGPVDAGQFDQVAHSFPAKGYTPITDSMLQAAASLPVGESEANTIILVSDGEETCGGDPCALAAQLAASDAQITIHAIGLAVDDVTRAQLQCIADASGGTYTDAQNADALTLALEEAAAAAANDTFQLVDGLGRPNVVRVSPDGKNVYVISFNNESLLAFARDETTGQLTYLGQQRNRENGVTGMDSPLGMDISPDGAHIYVSGDTDYTVVIFGRDAGSGELTYLETVDAFGDVAGLTGMRGLSVSPDGRNVYATAWHNGRRNDAIAVFQRDPATGSLARVQVLQNGVDGVQELAEINDVAVSPDGLTVYVSNADKTLVVFSREPGSGRLTQIQSLKDGRDLDWGLLGGSGMQVSADNRYLYLAANRGGAVTVFARNPADGALTFDSQLRNHAGPPVTDSGLQNLSGVHGLAISPDGNQAYVVTALNDFLVGFNRDQETGQLTYLEQFQDNVDGIDGLENGYAVAVSPDGRHLYLTGFDDNALAVFARDAANGRLTFVEIIRGRDE